MSPKTGPKSQKTASGPPHISDKKKHVANPKNESKKLKNTRFFHFFLAEVWRAGRRTKCFLKASVTTYQKQKVFSKKSPPQVNLNLSWLVPSAWSRPLHLRCGRFYVYNECNTWYQPQKFFGLVVDLLLWAFRFQKMKKNITKWI